MYLNPSARHWKTPYAIDSNVLDFHRKLPYYDQTPLRPLSRELCDQVHVKEIFLKDESNRFGLPAFKILGASWAGYRAVTESLQISSTSSLEELRRLALNSTVRLYAATDGNFGRAIARMAHLMGVSASIYVPKIMVEETKRLIASEGATVIVVQGDYDAAVSRAEKDSTAQGGLLVQDDAWPGYEKVPQWVVEGYSTMMVEIDEQVQKATGKAPDLLVVPVGVGSLAQAVVAHYKHKCLPPMIMTIEPDTAACLKTNLENGQQTTITTGDTNMCGMNCGTVSSLAWPYLRDGVDASITVTDAEAGHALGILSNMHVSTGPCSAGTLAALLKADTIGRDDLRLNGDSIVVLLGTEGPR